MDLDNVKPVNGGSTEPTDDQIQNGVAPKGVDSSEPAKSTAERKAEQAAKEAADKEAAEAIEGKQVVKDDEPPAGGDEAPKDDEDKDLDTSVWGDSGNEIANSVLQTLQNSGVTPTDAKALLWDAVEKGDPALVDRDALVEKVGKAKATLIMAGVENVVYQNAKAVAEVTSIATEAAGGEANWNKAREWAKKNIPAKELEELRVMFDRGGRQAKFAAQDIVDRYNSDEKNTSLNTSKQITPSGKGGTTVKPLSRREYGIALSKLGINASEAERASLLQRRKLGKQQGI